MTAEEVDAEQIRQTCEHVLWAEPPPAGERDRLGALLAEHARLLALEVASRVPRMRGERQRTAQHVLNHTRRILDQRTNGPESDLWDLAAQCRALLTLYLAHGSWTNGQAAAVGGALPKSAADAIGKRR